MESISWALPLVLLVEVESFGSAFTIGKVMASKDPKTSGTLLRRVQHWDDRDAWHELFRRYQPMLEKWTQARIRNPADAAEISQIVWCELTRRLKEFEYDSNRSFRGWLRRLHTSRLLDYLKGQRRYRTRLQRIALEQDGWASCAAEVVPPTDQANDGSTQSRLTEQVRLVQIQRRVQGRVSEQTWQIFWDVAIENQAISEVAEKTSMRYAAVFAAVTRVGKMLREEADRTCE